VMVVVMIVVSGLGLIALIYSIVHYSFYLFYSSPSCTQPKRTRKCERTFTLPPVREHVEGDEGVAFDECARI
jgi:hypothetical protein